MIAEIQNFPPLSPPRSRRTCKCPCQHHRNKVHNLASRQMSVGLLLPKHLNLNVKSQYSSLPIIPTTLQPILVKVDEQISKWVNRSEEVSSESSRSMSDTSDYFSSSPSNSKELVDSDYDSGQEWAHLPLTDLFTGRNESPISTHHSPQPLQESLNTSSQYTNNIPNQQVHLEQTPNLPQVPNNHESCDESSMASCLAGSEGSAPKNLITNSSPIKTKSSEDTRTRVKDNEGFIRRAACVCINEDESKVLLISSKTDPDGWLIPGGGLEEKELNEVAAEREAWEEAGVKGRILRSLGTFQSDDELTKKKKRTAVFVLKVTELHSDFPEATTYGRRRAWFTREEATQKLRICKPNQILYLQAL